MATYIVRMLERPDEFCGVIREVTTGASSPFVDPNELVALLMTHLDSGNRSQPVITCGGDVGADAREEVGTGENLR